MKAVIIHQADYSKTRLINCKGCLGCGDLNATADDGRVARLIAQGFGIKDKDIIDVENKNVK